MRSIVYYLPVNTLEQSAFFYLNNAKLVEFEETVKELLPFYSIVTDILTPSQSKYPLISLYLLMFITQNRTGEYFTEIEKLTQEELANEYIQIPVSIEQQFIDGNFQKFIKNTNNVPMPEYNLFITQLIGAIRNEAARSFEKCCRYMSIEEACKVFLINDPNEVPAFVEQQKKIGLENKIEWRILEGKLFFGEIGKETLAIPTESILNSNIEYATKLEKIV